MEIENVEIKVPTHFPNNIPDIKSIGVPKPKSITQNDENKKKFLKQCENLEESLKRSLKNVDATLTELRNNQTNASVLQTNFQSMANAARSSKEKNSQFLQEYYLKICLLSTEKQVFGKTLYFF